MLPGHTNWVEGCNLSPDGKVAATVSMDSTVKLWDAQAGKLLHTLTGHENAVQHGRVPGGRQETGDVQPRPHHSDLGRQFRHHVSDHRDDPHGGGLRSGRDVRRRRPSSPRRGTRRAGSSTRPPARRNKRASSRAPLSNREQLSAVVDGLLARTARALAVCGEEKAIKLLDSNTWPVAASAGGGHDDAISRVVFSPDGKTLASAGFDRNVILWDALKGTKKQILRRAHRLGLLGRLLARWQTGQAGDERPRQDDPPVGREDRQARRHAQQAQGRRPRRGLLPRQHPGWPRRQAPTSPSVSGTSPNV